MKLPVAVTIPRSGLRALAAACFGFTTIELLIVIVIAGILAVIAVPSMQSVLRNTRQSSAVSLLVSDLNQARGEAIKRNARALVCKRNIAGTGCDTTAPLTDWAGGWLVCTDANGDDTCDLATATNPNPVVVRPPLDASLTLSATAAPIRFNANSTGTVAVLTLGGTWSGAPARALAIAATGNITKP